MSLKYKIIIGFLSSIIPMLAIVAITYFPARDHALAASHRQIELISGNGSEYIDLFFDSSAKTFSNWIEEDVYGMALEFDALEELRQHFTSMLADHPDYELLLLTDATGTIREEGLGIKADSSATDQLKGSFLQEIGYLQKNPGRPVFVVPHSPLAPAAASSPRFVYRFQCTASSGKQNGYFLAYLHTAKLQDITDSIHDNLVRSGFSSNRVQIISVAEKEQIIFSGRPLSLEEKQFEPSINEIQRKATTGEIAIHDVGKRQEHIIYFPLNVSTPFHTSTTMTNDPFNLCLVVSVDEAEIVAGVNSTLKISGFTALLGLLATAIFGFLTIRTITTPLTNLVAVLQKYSGGDPEIRAEVQSNDEIGFFAEEFNTMLEEVNRSASTLQQSEARFRMLFEGLQEAVKKKDYGYRFSVESNDDDLASSLNKMLQTLEQAARRRDDEDWLKTGLTQLSEKISGEHTLEKLCRNAIIFIAGYTGVQIGTIFARGSKDGKEAETFDLIASYAYRQRKGLANRFKEGEGLVGQAALEKQILSFSDIPEDYIRIESSLGQTVPQNIVVIPLIHEQEVIGVIELGAALPFFDRIMTFAEQVSGVVAVAINSAIANEQMKSLLDKTRNQSEILKKQQQDLQKANEELEEQTLTLKESEARLQLQQEELQTSNEEMEEKNQQLEEQKQEIEDKNTNLEDKQREIAEKAKQLELATKYKSEFLSNMSHELRTPLNSILLLAKMLSENDEKNLSEDQIESAAAIHRGGQTLLHLINDILDLSKIEAGRVELNITSIKPETIKADFETEFNHLARSKGLAFTIKLAEDLPETIDTDVYRLEQIIRNLLGNACKFTEHGSVAVQIARADTKTRISRKDLSTEQAITISISDTGPGIPADKLTQIFEAFRQVDGSISRRYSGTGLGLSISKELSYLLEGELTVDSVLGQGSTFTLILPLKLSGGLAAAGKEFEPQSIAAPAARQVNQPKRTLPQPSFQTDEKLQIAELNPAAKRMLVIEDDTEFASILKNFFNKNGYETILASTGEEGVKFAFEYKPTAIILDIGLPGIDGWAVLRELKNNPETRHIPVHIMSAYDQTQEGLQRGAVGYLTKPVSIDGLQSGLAKIEHVLDNSVKELLVVEDDMQLRNNILKLMGTNDILATTAETGKKAMELLRTNRFDCMILDLGLPDISGFTLLDEIEHDNTIEKLPVIIYTGRDLTIKETEKLQQYSSSIVLKNALSMERLLDETALFMHRVEQEMPESHRKIIQEIREKESSIRGKKILLVDDDMRNAFALSKFLKNKGVEVSIANNGQKALEFLENDPIPDMVLMDIMMPVMNGFEAMKAIRSRNELKDLPILALTAKAMDTDRDECIRCGANDYLSKPIDTKKLLSMLRIWMY